MKNPKPGAVSVEDAQSSLVLLPGVVDRADVNRWGGKAANLVVLQRLGARVPPWFALANDAFDAVMTEAGLFEKIANAFEGVGAEDANLGELSATIRGWIEEASWPERLRKQVERSFDSSLGDQAMAAVRSSARDEDDDEFSFAGLHDSFLFVRRDGVVDAIRRVWSSAYTERAIGYRLRSGLDPVDVGIAVIVQEMVDAEVSGVIFTVEPAMGDVEQVLINTVWGAGEGLVGAGYAADSFTVDKQSGEVQAQVAKKEKMLVYDEGQGEGLVEVDVEASRCEAATLDEPMIGELVRFARVIENHYRRPQDIEFCVGVDGSVYWLQTRAVTTVDELGPAAGQPLLWDNSNIIESYSGVTTPMTFSFIEHAYTIVYECFSEVMGIPQQTVRRNMPVFRNMLGLVRGEVYYNLFNWYRLIRLFPGFQLNKEFMESMMGVDEPLDVEGESLETSFFEKAADVGSLARLALRSAINFGRIEKVADDFEAHFDSHFSQWENLDLQSMRPDELMQLYWEMEGKLLWNWKAPIINDFYVMISYGLLEKCCRDWCGDEKGTLQHDLICGEGGIATKEASEALIRLAKRAKEAPAVQQLILEGEPTQILEQLPAVQGSQRFLDDLQDYLDAYGYRSMEELKLEEPTMRENPGFVFQMMRNYLKGDDSVLDLKARRERELDIRRSAEEKAFKALSPMRLVAFKKVLSAARRGVRNRENMRFKRTKIYGLVREVLLAVADDFVRQKLLETRDDIFYLTIDEVWAFIKGTAVTTDLKSLVALRRREFESYRDAPERSPDDRFTTYGPVYHGNNFERRRKPSDVELEEGVLSGIGCCSGQVEKAVKVIGSPLDDMSLAGEILVAERTDPGWVPLYPSVSGVLIERGSVLSHSAIVAREMGLPTIVGIEGLMEAVKSGDVVRMDGEAGTVELVEAPE